MSPSNTEKRALETEALPESKRTNTNNTPMFGNLLGPLGIVLFNFGKNDFVIEEGDRIAQLVLEKIHMCDALEVEDLDSTERGSGGFGSTGVKLA
ncbi:hypothetical protein KVV02_003945 [Mortierella alpina]|uniref:dUTP diphosphatase n=1 Tax=Mortierella alpina TaxID=64518 RepID=A0A9P8CWK3_MORAP|nr:hypothetical protein KVV02_003945 [Mortierella alpina]